MEVQPTPTPLARIYQEHRKDLRKKLAREGVRKPDVDDVIHQMFSELHRDLADNADEPRDLVAWVYAAAHNKAVDYVRYHHRRAAIYAPGDVDELLENVASPALNAAEQLLDEEQRRFLREALQRLLPERRVVLEHRLYDELTVVQTAEVLGIPESTVRARLAAGWRDLEDVYARVRAEGERREGALVLPGTLAALLGFGWLIDLETVAGGRWVPREAGSGVPATGMGSPASAIPGDMPAPEWEASSHPSMHPSTRWSDVRGSILSFFGGAVVGVAALLLYLYKAGLIALPLHLRADETRAHSTDVPHDASLMVPMPPALTSSGATQLPPPSVPTPPQSTRSTERPLSEQDLIFLAQSAIRDGKIDRARAMLARHTKEFPSGSLKDTRDALLAALPP